MSDSDLKSFSDMVKKAVQEVWDKNAPQIERRLCLNLSQQLEEKLEKKLSEKIGKLPTRELFLSEMAKII